MAIRVCVAGATGWAGRAVTSAILGSSEFQLVGAVARQQVGVDIGEALDQGKAGVKIVASLEEALAVPTDVLIDYTVPGYREGPHADSPGQRRPGGHWNFRADRERLH